MTYRPTPDYLDDLDIMERDDVAFNQGRASLLDDPEEFTDDLFDLEEDDDTLLAPDLLAAEDVL